jgi:hypothetical protein
MQVPKRVIVGRRNGKRAINWPVVLVLGGIVGVVSGAAGGVTWFLLAKQFNVFAVLLPVVLFPGWFCGIALRRGWSVPIDQLPSLDPSGQ